MMRCLQLEKREGGRKGQRKRGEKEKEHGTFPLNTSSNKEREATGSGLGIRNTEGDARPARKESALRSSILHQLFEQQMSVESYHAPGTVYQGEGAKKERKSRFYQGGPWQLSRGTGDSHAAS